MSLQLTSRLISIPAQNNSTWTQRTADISAYIGKQARIVVLYQSGTSFRGDIQLDDFNIGGNSFTDFSSSQGFETNASLDNSQISSGNLDSIASEYPASWEAVGTSTSASGKFVRDSGGTPSSGTGNTSGNTGSFYLYAETSGSGSNNDIWLRSPEVTVNNGTLEFYSAQNGANSGAIYAYLEILGVLGVSATATAQGTNDEIQSFGVFVQIPNLTNAGWGRGTWGEGAWNSISAVNVDVSVTAVTATSALGSETATGSAGIDVTGPSGTSALGTATVTAGALASATGQSVTGSIGSTVIESKYAVTGVSGTSTLGAEAVTAGALVEATGVSSTTAVGTVLAAGGAIVEETGLTGSIGFGEEQVSASANVFPTGVSSTVSSGTVSVFSTVSISTTGLQATTSIGDVEVDDMAVGVSGLQATANTGIVTVWGRVVPDQNANVQEIVPSTTNTWSDITVTSTPDWKEVA